MQMPDGLALVILSAVVNGAVVWGVISTKLAWHKSLLDDYGARIKALEARQ